ncbi:hypothetical protein DMP13_06530 [Gordonibacter urolithinfaciens]|uniref:Uncharacterized protein n=1 Tax=Gordonibacter urolithinfaciens TaxID=1335613 RepID=A0A423UN57_9ACTN|nr:hypothetical protein DMP13_06530 [Gordonibacter urolithinfaciens]ROT91600.1 hypothetical protein DMP12_02825 [Gordonibacter urolithinfaciens]
MPAPGARRRGRSSRPRCRRRPRCRPRRPGWHHCRSRRIPQAEPMQRPAETRARSQRRGATPSSGGACMRRDVSRTNPSCSGSAGRSATGGALESCPL